MIRFQVNETEAAVKRELGVDAVIECVYDKVCELHGKQLVSYTGLFFYKISVHVQYMLMKVISVLFYVLF